MCINFEDIINEINIEIDDIEIRLASLGKTNQEITEIVVKL